MEWGGGAVKIGEESGGRGSSGRLVRDAMRLKKNLEEEFERGKKENLEL